MDMKREGSRTNILLSLMNADSQAEIMPLLEMVDLPAGFMLASRGEHTGHCYFLQSGIGLVLATSPDNKTSEVGIIGREGVVPVSPILDGHPTAFDILMQVGGRGLRIEVEALRRAIEGVPDLRRLLNKYIQAFLIQSAYTSLANANHTAQERLARWILMCHDRLDGDRIPLTHEFLAAVLAVRRPTITDAFHTLEEQRLIRAERGVITVRDRAGLERLAHGCYGRAEAQYREIIGEFR
jgi:CRP-like cAMP-binding protein